MKQTLAYRRVKLVEHITRRISEGRPEAQNLLIGLAGVEHDRVSCPAGRGNPFENGFLGESLGPRSEAHINTAAGGVCFGRFGRFRRQRGLAQGSPHCGHFH